MEPLPGTDFSSGYHTPQSKVLFLPATVDAMRMGMLGCDLTG
jgi:hypothetical protein